MSNFSDYRPVYHTSSVQRGHAPRWWTPTGQPWSSTRVQMTIQASLAPRLARAWPVRSFRLV